jgi:hypothetical protein
MDFNDSKSRNLNWKACMILHALANSKKEVVHYQCSHKPYLKKKDSALAMHPKGGSSGRTLVHHRWLQHERMFSFCKCMGEPHHAVFWDVKLTSFCSQIAGCKMLGSLIILGNSMWNHSHMTMVGRAMRWSFHGLIDSTFYVDWNKCAINVLSSFHNISNHSSIPIKIWIDLL